MPLTAALKDVTKCTVQTTTTKLKHHELISFSECTPLELLYLTFYFVSADKLLCTFEVRMTLIYTRQGAAFILMSYTLRRV